MDSLRPTVVAMISVLGAYGSALLLERGAHLRVDVVVTAVVLALTLARAQRDAAPGDRLLACVVMPPAAMAATWIAELIPRHPALGGALFAGAMAATIELRRFGPRIAAAGTVSALPLVASLVVPTGDGPAPPLAHTLWLGLDALIVGAWVGTVHLCAKHLRAKHLHTQHLHTQHFRSKRVRTKRVDAEHTDSQHPVAAPSRPQPGPRPRPRPTPRPVPATGAARRLSASTRMAIQTGVALGAAFACGRLLWPEHWSWAVLTTYIVCGGARGRGDALLKGVLRTLGAAAGTVLAAMLADTFGTHDPRAVPVIFALLALGTWLRSANYAYWAACVTAVLSLLYGWFGQPATELLPERLAAILLGAAFGVAAAWLILPIRTADVLRRRVADALAALTDLLGGLPDDRGAATSAVSAAEHPLHRFDAAVAGLRDLEPALRAHHRLVRHRRGGPRPAAVIDALRACTAPVHRVAERPAAVLDHASARAAVAANVVAVRRAIGRRPGAPYHPLPAELRCSAPQLADLDTALGRLAAIYAPPPGAPCTTTPIEPPAAPNASTIFRRR
ncbi:FUSC family protein [Embleya scabrispora]|uniref:FUSC family protein n=1 Tax=Embleya scabrispora TaxID=159449 RepID=UPI0003A322F7|nr:FUSC family protein [Embleya scabrispora]MYS80585.1 hypothetical protein [Streptomyces sp. SID5474]